jgi:hypothetical protein
MRLYVSTVILTLAWFSAANIVSSALAWLAARGLHRSRPANRPRAQLLFAVRMAPSVISMMFALALFLPVHLLYERREGSEYFGALLLGLALLAVALIAGSVLRVAAAVRACGRFRRTWTDPGRDRKPIVDDSEFLGMSLAGIVRTTIIVGKRVREALTGEELDVALAHEVAHRQSWDNVKRLAIFASPDFLRFSRIGRRLEQEWSAEVECLADARAVQGNASRAANLASALLKVARLAASTPGSASAGPLWSTFFEEALLEVRVRRLVEGPAVAARPSWLLSVSGGAAVLGTIALAWLADIPRAVHVMTEVLVRLLP